MNQNKVAVISGATSGIGRATAIGLGKAGYRVAILGRRQEELEATAELAGAAYSATCDVTDPSAVHRYFSGVLAKLGRVDVVFNNHYRAKAVVNAKQFENLLTKRKVKVPAELVATYPDALEGIARKR